MNAFGIDFDPYQQWLRDQGDQHERDQRRLAEMESRFGEPTDADVEAEIERRNHARQPDPNDSSPE